MKLLDPSIPILLLEDDAVDIEDIYRAFKRNNISNPLYIAKNGQEALDILRGEKGHEKLNPLPKIVLLDINMPKMNGIEFLKILRNDTTLNSLLVFVLTSSDDSRDRVAAYQLNVAGYILKPLQFADVNRIISSLYAYWSLLEFAP